MNDLKGLLERCEYELGPLVQFWLKANNREIAEKVQDLAAEVRKTAREMRTLGGNDPGEFLRWIAGRLVNVYGESENVDFVQNVRHIARMFGDERR